MKLLKKVSSIVCLVLLVFVLHTSVFAATVGQPLTSPEAGWQRIDGQNSLVVFSGTHAYQPYAPCFGGGAERIYGEGSKVTFYFTGTEFRIITVVNPNCARQVEVTVDGTVDGSFNPAINPVNGVFYLMYEKIGMPSGYHKIILTVHNDPNGSTGGFFFDAIDIDDSGQFVSGAEYDGQTPTMTSLVTYTSMIATVGPYTPPSINPGSQIKPTFSVTGAQVGDFVEVSYSTDLQGITLTGYVSASNTVTAVFFNGTAAAITLPQGTLKVKLTRLVVQ
jgi:hypothetical protein